MYGDYTYAVCAGLMGFMVALDIVVSEIDKRIKRRAGQESESK